MNFPLLGKAIGCHARLDRQTTLLHSALPFFSLIAYPQQTMPDF
jgi:hypothetical protein